jgi:hypothetical protein
MSAPRLSIFAKSLFLKYQGQKIFKHLSEENFAPMSEFLKSLVSSNSTSNVIVGNFQLISRQFLRASQLYRVYYFMIAAYSDNKFVVRFAYGAIVGRVTKTFKLTLSEIQRRNQLLNVQYLYLWEYTHEYATEYAELCKIFKGTSTMEFVLDPATIVI